MTPASLGPHFSEAFIQRRLRAFGITFWVSTAVTIFAFLAAAFFTPQSANAQAAPKVNPNAIETMTLNEGSPVEIRYKDGRVARLLRKETIEEFRTDITLVENTCRPVVGLKCRFVLPYVRQWYVGLWTRHPERQGLALEYGDLPDHTFGAQTFVTRSQNDLFENLIRRATPVQGVKVTEHMGRLECESPLPPALPKSVQQAKRLVFWDESYEQGNEELAIATEQGKRVTQIWRRYENVDLDFDGATAGFHRYRRAYGVYTDYHPLGIAYRYLMTFRGENIYDSSDDACFLKWDVDFSQYFTQLSAVLQDGGQGRPNLQLYRPFNYSGENVNPYALKPFQQSTWDNERMR